MSYRSTWVLSLVFLRFWHVIAPWALMYKWKMNIMKISSTLASMRNASKMYFVVHITCSFHLGTSQIFLPSRVIVIPGTSTIDMRAWHKLVNEEKVFLHKAESGWLMQRSYWIQENNNSWRGVFGGHRRLFQFILWCNGACLLRGNAWSIIIIGRFILFLGITKA